MRARGGVRVRRATAADLPRIAAIEAASFADPWPEDLLDAYFADAASIVLVAEEQRTVGFLIARIEPSSGGTAAHIHDLAVDPSHRKQGVATALLDALIRRGLKQRITTVRLEVRLGNDGARTFYERRGFRLVETLPHYYEDGEDACRMELVLFHSEPPQRPPG